MKEILTGLSGDPAKLYSDGLHVGGVRYVVTTAADRSLYARQVGSVFLVSIIFPRTSFGVARTIA